MQSIQIPKQTISKQLEQASPRNIWAININSSTQRAEVVREVDAAIRGNKQITVCIITH